MITRFFLVLFAFGLFLQGCTLQKRSLMPGWHVERVGQAPYYSDARNLQPVEYVATQTSASRFVTAPTHLDPLVPVKSLMRFTPPIKLSSELTTPLCVERAKLHDPQPLDEVAQYSGVESPQPAGEDTDKKRKRKLSALSALLSVAAIVAWDLLSTPTVGLVLIAVALTVLRFAFPFEEPELPQERPIQEDGLAKRIAMGVLGGVLGIASISAFSFGFFDPSLWPFLLGGAGLAFLSLRAFFVAFPNAFSRLRARLTNPDKAEARRRKQRRPSREDQPNRDWLWLLALIPVAFIILVISNFSFVYFGM